MIRPGEVRWQWIRMAQSEVPDHPKQAWAQWREVETTSTEQHHQSLRLRKCNKQVRCVPRIDRHGQQTGFETQYIRPRLYLE